MNAIIGALRVILGMDSAAFDAGANDAERRMERFRQRMQRAGQQIQSVGRGLTVGLTLPLVAFAERSVAAQRKQEDAIASVSAALSTMGDAAGFTLPELEAMASGLQQLSTFGDEDILRNVTSNLLTFGGLSGEVFERTQALALDLSAQLGQDLKSSAIQLGKALNDPARGLTALTRIGVVFTEEQRAQIVAMQAAGDMAGAQAIMLGVLEEQYGMAAETLAATDSGRITQAWGAIGDAMEKIGAIILPIAAEFATHIKTLAERFQALSPETQRWVVIAGALAAALGPITVGLGIFVASIGTLGVAIAAISLPMVAVVGGIAAIAAGAAFLYRNWDGISGWFRDLWASVRRWTVDAWDAISDKITAARAWLDMQWSGLGNWAEATFGAHMA